MGAPVGRHKACPYVGAARRWRFAETMRSAERGQGKQRHLGSTRD
jgi:hypothetical protein